MSDLVLPAINGHDEVRFSLKWNQPVPYQATLYRDGGRCTMQQLKEILRAKAAPYDWLMKEAELCGVIWTQPMIGPEPHAYLGYHRRDEVGFCDSCGAVIGGNPECDDCCDWGRMNAHKLIKEAK